MRHGHRGTGLLVIGVGCALLLGAAAGEDPWEFKAGSSAQAAKRKYDAAVEKAHGEYLKQVASARKTLQEDLERSLRDVMRAGDAKQVSRIQAAVDQLKQGKLSNLKEAGAGVVGVWRVRYTNGHEREYVVAEDGTVTCKDANNAQLRGRLQELGADVLLDLGDGKVERVTRAGARLLVEHYNPAKQYPSERPTHLGIGEAVLGR